MLKDTTHCHGASRTSEHSIPSLTFYQWAIVHLSKKGCKDQESIQSSTTPDPGYQWKSDKLTVIHHKREPLKRQLRLQQTKNVCDIFLNFQKNTVGLIFHENCLPADNSHEISCLVYYFWKSSKIGNCRLLQIIGGTLWVKISAGLWGLIVNGLFNG